MGGLSGSSGCEGSDEDRWPKYGGGGEACREGGCDGGTCTGAGSSCWADDDEAAGCTGDGAGDWADAEGATGSRTIVPTSFPRVTEYWKPSVSQWRTLGCAGSEGWAEDDEGSTGGAGADAAADGSLHGPHSGEMVGLGP